MDSPSSNVQRQASSRSSISSTRTTSTRTLRLASPALSTLALPTVTAISASSAANPVSSSLTVPAMEDSHSSIFSMKSALQKDNNTIQARQAELERIRAGGNGKGKGKGKGRDRTWVTSEFGGEGGGEAGIFLGKRRLIESPLEEILPKQDQAISALPPLSPPPLSPLPTTSLLVSPTTTTLSSNTSQETELTTDSTQIAEESVVSPMPAKQHSWFPWASSPQDVSSSDPVSAPKSSGMTGTQVLPSSLSSSSLSFPVSTAESTLTQPLATAQINASSVSQITSEFVATVKPTQLIDQQASPEIVNSLAWLHPSRLSRLQIPAVFKTVSVNRSDSDVEPVSCGKLADDSSGEAEVTIPDGMDVMVKQESEPTPLTTDTNASKGRWVWTFKNGSAHQSSPSSNVQIPVGLLQSSEISNLVPTEIVATANVDQEGSSQEPSLPVSDVSYSGWWSYLGYGPTRGTPAPPSIEVLLSDETTKQPSVVSEHTGEVIKTDSIADHPSNALPDAMTPVVVSTSSYLNPISWVWPSSTSIPVSVPTSMPTIPSGDIASIPSSEMPISETPSHCIPSTFPITTSLPVPNSPRPDAMPIALAVPTSVSYSSWLGNLTPTQFRTKESVPSSPSSSVTNEQKILDAIGKVDRIPLTTDKLKQVSAVLDSGNHVESSLDERENIRQKSSLSMLASKLRLSPSSPNLPSFVSSSDLSTDTTVPTTLHPRDLSSDRPISSVPTSRRQSTLVSLPPPNLVLPTFSDIFDRPPRSTPLRPLPSQPLQDPTSDPIGRVKKRTVAKNAISSLASYVYGSRSTNVPGDADAGQRETTSVERMDSQYLEDPELKKLPKKLVVQRGLKEGDEEGKALGIECVKKVVVIGVHGWFPNAIVRYIAGEPTGTSTAFAKKMAKMVENYFGEGTLEKITAVPLEGEGKVEYRVDRLFKEYMSNPEWVDDLRAADAIIVATHSQGCLVSTYLIERLYAQGHIRSSSNQSAVNELKLQIGPLKGEQHNRKPPKVLMLGLCGTHLGPLAYLSSSSVVMPYIQYFENAAAHQLFEFQDTESATSKSYMQSLSNVLDQGCKLVYVASLNDQVVPVYSAIFSVAHHPNILRVLHIDGIAYDVSDFVTKLLTFCLQLLNAGLSDGGLVAHLSESVAAGLTGIGHSTAYGEDLTYLLAIRYLFETTSNPVAAGSLEVDEFLASEERNGYEIPWILRGIMEDPSVLRYFGRELDDLRSSFDRWDPKTAKMKDLRRKLEPLRSRKSRRTNERVESLPPSKPKISTATSVPPTVEPNSSSVEVVQNSPDHHVPVSLNQDW